MAQVTKFFTQLEEKWNGRSDGATEWISAVSRTFQNKEKCPSMWNAISARVVKVFGQEVKSDLVKKLPLDALACFDCLILTDPLRAGDRDSSYLRKDSFACCKHSIDCKSGKDNLKRTVELVDKIRALTRGEDELGYSARTELVSNLTRPLCWNASFRKRKITAPEEEKEVITKYCCEHTTERDRDFREQILRSNTQKRKRYDLLTTLPEELLTFLFKASMFGE